MHVQQREKAVGQPTCSSFIRAAAAPFVCNRFVIVLVWTAPAAPISKESLQVRLSVIDTNGRVVVKGSTKIANKPAAFAQLGLWVNKHCKMNSLPLRYVMESTGVYHEAIAWYLYQKDQAVCSLLPNKAKHYLKSLGYNRGAGAIQE